MRAIILENIRSAYNVGNMIRTADALGFDVIISGYTPSPSREPKVLKSSLGAENIVKIFEFTDNHDALVFAKDKYHNLIAAEKTDSSLPLNTLEKYMDTGDMAIVFGNEVHGVLAQTLEFVDHVFHIPMIGIKESFNVGQSSAIFMREIFRNQKGLS